MVKYGEGIWHCLHPEFLEDQLATLARAPGPRDARRLPAAQPRVLPEGRARAQPRHARVAARGVRRAPARGVRVPGGRGGGRAPPAATASRRTRSRPRRTIRRRRRSSACWAPARPVPSSASCSSRSTCSSGRRARAEPGPGPIAHGPGLRRPDGVGVLVNRPLNAFRARPRPSGRRRRPGAGRRLGGAARRWSRAGGGVSRSRAAHIQTEDGSPPDQFFRWADDLRGLRTVNSLDHWDQLESQRIVPRVSDTPPPASRHARAGSPSPRPGRSPRTSASRVGRLRVPRVVAGFKHGDPFGQGGVQDRACAPAPLPLRGSVAAGTRKPHRPRGTRSIRFQRRRFRVVRGPRDRARRDAVEVRPAATSSSRHANAARRRASNRGGRASRGCARARPTGSTPGCAGGTRRRRPGPARSRERASWSQEFGVQAVPPLFVLHHLRERAGPPPRAAASSRSAPCT